MILKSATVTAATLLTIWGAWALSAPRARGQICASAGCGSLDSGSLGQEPCLDEILNYLEDDSSCSGTDECGNTSVTLQWGLEYDGGAYCLQTEFYSLSGVCYPTYTDCDCSTFPGASVNGFYDSNMSGDETNVYGYFDMYNAESVNWANCTSGACGGTGVQDLNTSPYVQTGSYVSWYIDDYEDYISQGC